MKIRSAVIIALALVTSAAFAETGPAGDRKPDPAKFAEMKQKVLARMDQNRSCVQAAQDHEAMKACHRPGK